MRSIIIPALAALGLAAASPALAAPPDTGGQHDHQGDHGDHGKGNPPPGGSGPSSGPSTGTGHQGPIMKMDQHGTGTQTDHHDTGTQTDHHNVTIQGNPPSGPVMHGEDHTMRTKHAPPPPPPKRYDWGEYHQGQTPPTMKHAPRLDFHSWQRNFGAPKHFHWQPYHQPNGWYYRRWVFGMVLPSFFWTQDYWINDYWDFDLPDPPYGYVWVRYGDDALLVNVRTGFILQVEYDLFD